MVKKERRSRTKHNNGKRHATPTPPKERVGYGNLYTSPTQHLKVDDPNTIFLSATTPTVNVINYIMKRLIALGAANHAKIREFCPGYADVTSISPSELPALDTIHLMAVGMCTQRAVSILEILKRRVPTLLTNIQIGLIDNTARLIMNQAAQSTEKTNAGTEGVQFPSLFRNVPPPVTKGKKKGTPVITQELQMMTDAPQPAITPKFAPTAHAMKITLLIKETIVVSEDTDDIEENIE